MGGNPKSYRGSAMPIPAPVSAAYCVPYVTIFEVDYARGQFPCGKHKLTIKDTQGKVVLNVKTQNHCGLHAHDRVVCDPAGNVLVLLRKKMFTFSPRWSAFRGEYDNDSKVLLNLSTSPIFRSTPEPSFDIFLASNRTSSPDFVVTGDYTAYNYNILFNGSPMAEVRPNAQVSPLRVYGAPWNILVRNRAHVVTILPGVDQTLIASIVAIMDKLKVDFDFVAIATCAVIWFIVQYIIIMVWKGI